MQLSLQNWLLEITGLVLVEGLTPFYAKKAQKLYRKLPKTVKELENSQFF